jgi:hypothetical protein
MPETCELREVENFTGVEPQPPGNCHTGFIQVDDYTSLVIVFQLTTFAHNKPLILHSSQPDESRPCRRHI